MALAFSMQAEISTTSKGQKRLHGNTTSILLCFSLKFILIVTSQTS